MIDNLVSTTSCSPVAPYIGGKRILASLLNQIISNTPHDAYAEAFVGMGGVFLRRTKRPKAEIINDRSKEVSNLFRILQRHYQQFLDTIRWQLATRADFERLLNSPSETLTDLERAARFLYLQRLCFSGKVGSKVFGVSPTEPSRFDLTKLVPLLEAAHDRLSGVTIENLDWADFIERYDRPGMLFYLDPPYYGCENDYGKDMFPRSDFEKMSKILSCISGKFILSLNDRPEVREIFSEFYLKDVSVNYSIGSANGREFSEVLISNFDLAKIEKQTTLF